MMKEACSAASNHEATERAFNPGRGEDTVPRGRGKELSVIPVHAWAKFGISQETIAIPGLRHQARPGTTEMHMQGRQV
jgi:hypothetical protein